MFWLGPSCTKPNGNRGSVAPVWTNQSSALCHIHQSQLTVRGGVPLRAPARDQLREGAVVDVAVVAGVALALVPHRAAHRHLQPISGDCSGHVTCLHQPQPTLVRGLIMLFQSQVLVFQGFSSSLFPLSVTPQLSRASGGDHASAQRRVTLWQLYPVDIKSYM